jgi:methylphosphotriester-DNA--protein-cysteine methyltransferase
MPWELPADEDRCYAAVASRDDRFDGWFIIGVRTTGIYCRPSRPTPAPQCLVLPHRGRGSARRVQGV